jgi:hypothetical protein
MGRLRWGMVLVHLRRSCYAIGPPMVDLGYETTSLYSTIDR